MNRAIIGFLAALLPVAVGAANLTVSNGEGQPMATAMVTRTVIGADAVDTSDNGYPKPGVRNRVTPQHTKFTGADGSVSFAPLAVEGQRSYRVRKQGYADQIVTAAGDGAGHQVGVSPIKVAG